MIGRLALDEQLDALRATLTRNELLTEVLARAARLDLPGWYLTAGCLFQTVWNVVTGRPPGEGIKDYDLFYFDDSDLGWDAENEVIQAGDRAFRDLVFRARPTPPPKRPSTRSRPRRVASACASTVWTDGVSMRRTALPTCSTSSSVLIPCSRGPRRD